jgi:hypothetical protein
LRILGTAANRGLLLTLPASEFIRVAGPRLLRNPEEDNDPTTAIFRARCCQLPGDMGGWCLYSPRTAAGLQFAASADTASLQRHPAWPSLAIIGTLDPTAAAWLLAEIGDPRFFALSRQDDWTAALRHFGCTPRYQSSGGRRGERFRRLLDVWKNSVTPAVADKYLDRPENFLWRRWNAHAVTAKGDLRANQSLLVHVLRYWRGRLYEEFHPGESFYEAGRLFRPGEEVVRHALDTAGP